MTERRLLLAGSVGPERLPVRRDRDDADWFKPAHVRDEAGTRGRFATQVAGGVDVVVAPTWLTHRRALLPLGETRRVAAWSAAAVRTTRTGVEIGLERRAETLASASQDPLPPLRPPPLVAAVLPALDDEPEPQIGRLLPREAATERDYRDQAGVLTDAEPDVLLVEGQRHEAEARIAMAEAAATGLPVWVALSEHSLTTTDLEDWLDRARSLGVARLLLPPPLEERLAATDADMPWGFSAGSTGSLIDWLDAGAGAVAQLNGASMAALGPLRSAIDDYERAEFETAQHADRRWLDHVARAAQMAPGGAAVWLGGAPDFPLPDGFEWLVVAASEEGQLPTDHFRLVVAAEVAPGVGHRLQRGGVLVVRGTAATESPQLRLVERADDARPQIAIYRRDA